MTQQSTSWRTWFCQFCGTPNSWIKRSCWSCKASREKGQMKRDIGMGIWQLVKFTDRSMPLVWLGIGVWAAVEGNAWLALFCGWSCRARLNELLKP